MTKRLFSTAKKRRSYRPRGYRSVFATDVDPETEEETTSEVSEEEVGLSADEFTGDLTDDPLADLADESIWAVTPGTDEDYSVTEDDFEREEAITNTSSRRVANDEVLDSLNPTGTIFTEYAPEDRAGLELAPHIRPYSEVNGVDPDERMVVYRGVPKGVQSELADGDFITDMEQLAKDYAGYPYGDVISQEVFADEILDDMEYPMSGEYLFRPRRASKKTSGGPYSVYHGTSSSAAEKIRNEGLKPPTGMGARWFMLTDSYDQAARYAPADQDPVVMEFSVSDSDIYSRGNKDSVLWQATPHSAYGFDANAYAVRGDSLPSSYLKGVHPVAGEKTSSRREADRFQDDKYQPGTLYRGLSVDLLSDDEVNTLQDWATRNSFDPEDPDGFDFAEPNFEMIYPILERLEESGGLGRHWSKDYDVAEAFAGGWANDDPGNQGIVLRVDWDGSGIDTEYDESYTRPDGSTGGVYNEEKEVNLAPGAGANLVGIDFTDTWGNKSNIPVPNVPVYASRRRAKKANSEFPALPEDFVRNISPDGFDSRWTYETTGYEPRSSDDRYDLSINPVNSPAVIPGEENGLRKKPIFYDPERTELEWDDLFGHSPTRQDRDLSHLAPPEGLLWRGMSNEEYENAKRDGYFQSKGDWNFEGQEGETYFSTDPDAAANYANDFAPIQFKPGFGNPAHVIGIPDRPELPRYEHEVGVPGQIPFSDVVQHYTGHPTAISPGSSSYFNDISTGEWSEGGGSGPSVSLAWERGEGYEPKTSRRNPGGFSYDTPVPDIKVRAHRRTPERKKDPMTAIDRYLRYASRRGMDPQSKSTLRAFARSGRGTSKTAQRDISRWFVAQKVAHDTARDVLASSRNYRRKMSSSWHLDNKLSAYVSKVQQKFACSCGAKLDVPAYNICKCGKIWNAYKVHSATKGDTMYVVREVPVRENVLVAGRGKTASRRRQAQGGSWKANDNSRPYGGFDNPATYELIETLANDPYAIEQAQYAESADDLWDIGLEVMPQGFDFSSVNWKQVDENLNADFYDDYHDGPARNVDKRVSRRRQAYDVEEDTFDFFEKARDRGYRFPKNMGDDPDSGTFQDELHNYTGGDRDRMRQVTDFARDNWGQHRHFDPYLNR